MASPDGASTTPVPTQPSSADAAAAFDPYTEIVSVQASGATEAKLTVQTAEDTVLVTMGGTPSAAAVAANYRVQRIPTDGDFTIIGDVVRIEGPLTLKGYAFEVNARVLEYGVDAQGNAALVDTSGPDPAKAKAPATKNPTPAADGSDATHVYNFLVDDDNTPAISGTPGAPGAAGAPGSVGKPAGWVDIRCGSLSPISNAVLTVNADGGAGGDGGMGQDGQNGGKGGDGYSVAYEGIADLTKPCDGADAGAGGPGGPGGPPGPGGAGGMLSVLSMTAIPPGLTATNANGNHGKRGPAGTSGSDGKPGRGGNGEEIHGMDIPSAAGGGVGDPLSPTPVATRLAGPATQAAKTLSATSGVSGMLVTATAGQLQMLAERIHRDRLVLDVNDDAAVKRMFAQLHWLQDLTAAYPASAPDAPAMAAVSPDVAGIIKQLMDPTLDAFGHTPDWAPLASMAEYDALLQDSLPLLSTMEEKWAAYRQARIAAQEADDEYAAAAGQLADRDTALKDQIDQAWTQLGQLTHQIDAMVDEVDAAKQAVLAQIDNFKARVADQTNFSFDSFLSVVGQTAFAPWSSDHPAASGNGGEPEAGATGVAEEAGSIPWQPYLVGGSAAASWLYTGFTTLKSDSGQAIPKTYLVGKLDTYGKSVSSLDEAYETMNGLISNDDPNAYKLLTTQQSLEDLLSNFQSVPGAKAAQDAMDDYVKQVQARNAKILEYNSCASSLAQLSAQKQQLAIQQSAAQHAEASMLVPRQDAFVQALYDAARMHCIGDLYNASRAYRFWSLQDEDFLADVLKIASLSDVTADAVSEAHDNLLRAGVQTINSMAGKLEPLSDPVVVSFTATSHPGILARLTKDRRKDPTKDPALPRYCSFSLDAATKDSLAADTPFVGMVNVRLVEVRCWLLGLESAADSTGKLRVHLTQQGDEVLVAGDDDGLAVSVSHDPVASEFVYRVGGTLPDANAIESHCQYWDADVGGQDILHVPDLTPVGPFATWQIALLPNEVSPNTEWSSLTEIRLEFFVKYHAVPVSTVPTKKTVPPQA